MTDLLRCHSAAVGDEGGTVRTMNTGQQRVVLVTGASSGIGLASASYLASRGFRVYGTSRRVPENETVLTGHAAAQGQADQIIMLTMDVTSDQSVKQGVERILSREGRLDIAINNAGMGIVGPVEKTTVEEARRQLEVNFFGAFRVCREVLRPMRQQGGGYIVNIGSIAGVIAIPYQAMYCASKFALEGLSESMRLEVRPFGVKVSVVQPGDHRTALTQNRQCTAAAHEDLAYSRPLDAALAQTAQDEQAGPGPEKVAHLVHRIVNLPNPRLRYTVGPPVQRAAVWLKRFFPYSLIEHTIRIYYHLEH
jgi:NAD(P)-dependent dehydrogenase (short-subunit alcohol dehydrogenase family)